MCQNKGCMFAIAAMLMGWVLIGAIAVIIFGDERDHDIPEAEPYPYTQQDSLEYEELIDWGQDSVLVLDYDWGDSTVVGGKIVFTGPVLFEDEVIFQDTVEFEDHVFMEYPLEYR